MPTVKKDGKDYGHIEFDPAKIAQLLYSGYQVFPDKGTSEADIQAHKELINAELSKLWGDQKSRTVTDEQEVPIYPVRFPHRKYYFNGPDPIVDTFPRTNVPSKRVIPNPLDESNTPTIDDLADPKEIITEANAQPSPSGTSNIVTQYYAGVKPGAKPPSAAEYYARAAQGFRRV